MSEEITKEERELIIKSLRESDLEGCEMSKILFGEDYCNRIPCIDCGKAIKNKLISLIESAPAKKNIRASEFADKFEKAFHNNINSIYDTIAECLGYDGNETSGSEDLKRFLDAIRNLDAPEGIPYPLDKDGVPIKIGDTVYSNSGNKYEVIGITIGKNQNVSACQNGRFPAHFRYPESELSHNAPRTLEEIIKEAKIVFSEDDLQIGLIQEAYEMGRKAAGNV